MNTEVIMRVVDRERIEIKSQDEMEVEERQEEEGAPKLKQLEPFQNRQKTKKIDRSSQTHNLNDDL